MLDHNIIEVLKSLSEEETGLFRKFLESPYFNTSELALRLYDEIIKYYPAFDNASLTKESLYSKLGNGRGYNDSTMRNLLADLVRAAEKFLKQQNFENSRRGTNVHLLDEIVKRGLGDLFHKNAALTQKLLDSEKEVEGVYFLDRYQYESDKFNMSIARGSNVSSLAASLSDAGTSLVSYFVIEIIKVYDYLLRISRMYNLDTKNNPLNKFIDTVNLTNLVKLLGENSKENNFIFELYFKLYSAFTNMEDAGCYHSYKNLLFENSDSISRDEKQFLYGRLLDYCQIKSNLGDEKYDAELFENVKIFLMYEYYRTGVNNFIPVALYRNILLLCLRLKEYDWLDFFVKVYLNKVEPDQQENIYHYTYASICFARKDYAKSLEHLMNVNYDHFVFKLDMKSLLLRIYYELNYCESAYSLIDCYNHILRRSKLISQGRKTKHGNFISYVQKLLKLKLDPDQRGEGKVLHSEISNRTDILNKDWLLEKSSELDKNYKKAI